MFGRKKRNEGTSARGLHCSFCNKSQHDIRQLIAGPKVYICNECVDICVDVIAGIRKDQTEADETDTIGNENLRPRSRAGFCALCRLPVGVAEATVVENRGLLCKGCRGEIEAAIAREITKSAGLTT
jgi:hypothetical protein